MTTPIRLLLIVATALSLVATACAADAPEDSSGTAATPEITAESDAAAVVEGEEEGHDEEFWFGTPAESTDATRVIEITATDDFRFAPDVIDVEVGEAVTFRVTNTGNLPHDFTLGDAQMQDDHDAEMAEMAGSEMADEDPNAFTLDSGETGELTWMFTEEGSILMGCHVPGHYAAGMRGEIMIVGG